MSRGDVDLGCFHCDPALRVPLQCFEPERQVPGTMTGSLSGPAFGFAELKAVLEVELHGDVRVEDVHVPCVAGAPEPQVHQAHQ